MSDKDIMFSVVVVDLFVFPFVSYQHYAKFYEWIAMKFYGGARDGKKNRWLNFCGDLDHHADYPTRNLAIIQQMSEFFGMILITMLTLQMANPDNMWVMSCLVGGLCSLSALVKLYNSSKIKTYLFIPCRTNT